MDSQVQVDGRHLDIITEDWRKEKLTFEDIAVPLSELPPPESDSTTPTETVRQLDNKWLDLNLTNLAEALNPGVNH
jgi:anaphase-promoting complex subunit 13